jgi:hypothetical protein
MKGFITILIIIVVVFLIGKAIDSNHDFGIVFLFIIIGLGAFGIIRGLLKK